MTVGRPKETAKTTLKSEPLGESRWKNALWVVPDMLFGHLWAAKNRTKRAPVDTGPTKSDIEKQLKTPATNPATSKTPSKTLVGFQNRTKGSR